MLDLADNSVRLTEFDAGELIDAGLRFAANDTGVTLEVADTEGTGSYTTGSVNTATGLRLSARETPQSVSVVTRQQIEDQNLNDVAQVLEQTPGVVVDSMGPAGSDANHIYVRGFEVGSIQVDGINRPDTFGFRDDLSDMVSYDRVEVVRGATGLMSGTGDPGATVNLIRKAPTKTFGGSAYATYGSWDKRRLGADLNLPLMSDKQNVDVLFWVGDGAFDMRNQRTLRAFVKVLKAAKVDFAVLGLEERDSGDVARRLGDEATFQLLAKRNIATLAKYQFKRIVTCDPHSFHVLKNEYGELGGRYSVLHHSTYMDELISGQKLNLGQHKGGSVTYHDPCYLGRYNGEYEAPRNVLNAIGIEVKEMQRSGFRSRCCGGGGGAPITDIPGKQRIPDMRMVDIKETAAELVAVGCPQCTAMLEGVVGPRPEVKDIAELVADVLIEGVVEVKKPASVPREAAEVSP